LDISSYDDLLSAAAQQAEPQRLLFVFASAELPANCTDTQKAQFGARRGGALAPVMCVDKLPAELGSFDNLVEESRQTGMNWDIVFVSSMSGQAGIAPSSKDADRYLEMMVESVKSGSFGKFLAFDRNAALVQFSKA
jgi:hypothetical protein